MAETTRGVPTAEESRYLLRQLAAGELDVEWRDVALQAVACELVALQARIDDELAEAIKVLGALTAGMMGWPVAEDADDLLKGLNAAAARSRT